MAGIKISALPSATIPLAGTELLAIVQGGATKQTPVSSVSRNLTGPVTSVGLATTIVGPIPAVTLSGTINASNNIINNARIGVNTPNTANFTTLTATTGITSNGVIYSTATGFKFPDNTIQATAAIVATGTYTPVRTFDGTGNMSLATPGPANYFRVGSMVTVSGSVAVRTTVYPGIMRFFLSLPIASAITGVSDAVFGTFCGNTTLQLGAVLNSTANNLAWFCGDTIASTQAGTVNIYYTYVYKIV